MDVTIPSLKNSISICMKAIEIFCLNNFTPSLLVFEKPKKKQRTLRVLSQRLVMFTIMIMARGKKFFSFLTLTKLMINTCYSGKELNVILILWRRITGNRKILLQRNLNRIVKLCGKKVCFKVYIFFFTLPLSLCKKILYVL